MPTTQHVGFAGEAMVASEFSVRGYHVSLPMVDTGTDLIIENDNTGQVWRIQVKTSQEKATHPNYYQFGVKETAIHLPTAKASHFAFVLRIADEWKVFMVAQAVLSDLVRNHAMGSLTPGAPSRVFTFIHTPATGSVTCSGTDMLPYSGAAAWNPWPVI
jgi:hypothetical protein